MTCPDLGCDDRGNIGFSTGCEIPSEILLDVAEAVADRDGVGLLLLPDPNEEVALAEGRVRAVEVDDLQSGSGQKRYASPSRRLRPSPIRSAFTVTSWTGDPTEGDWRLGVHRQGWLRAVRHQAHRDRLLLRCRTLRGRSRALQGPQNFPGWSSGITSRMLTVTVRRSGSVTNTSRGGSLTSADISQTCAGPNERVQRSR